MKRVSPSFHSLDCRSSVRGVDAMVKFATAAPEGVNRSSGSPVRFPIRVMGGSPAIAVPPAFGCDCVYSYQYRLVPTVLQLLTTPGVTSDPDEGPWSAGSTRSA